MCLTDVYQQIRGGDTETVPTGSITIQSGTGSVTIPAGVNVVKIEIFWTLGSSSIEFSYVEVTAGKTYNLQAIWTEYNAGEGEIYDVSNTVNWKFWLYLENGVIDVETGYKRLLFKVSWSPTINEQLPHWTDY